MSEWNVVDSSAWLEYFAGTPESSHFAATIERTDRLIVPIICIYEVFKKVSRESSEVAALAAISAMQSGQLIELDMKLALAAARLKLPLADSLIYAVTQEWRATLWTQDEHFKGLEGVRFFKKQGNRE